MARATPVHTCLQGKVSMEFGTKTSSPRMHYSHAYASTTKPALPLLADTRTLNSLDSGSSVSPPQRKHYPRARDSSQSSSSSLQHGHYNRGRDSSFYQTHHDTNTAAFPVASSQVMLLNMLCLIRNITFYL